MEIIVLGVVAGVSMLSYALWRKSRSADPPRALLEERAAARLLGAEPTLTGLRVGDVVSHLRLDYVIEAVLAFDDDGRVTRLYRLADGNRVRWLAARADSGDALLLDEIADLGLPLEVNAPSELVHAGAPFHLTARAHTRVSLSGALPRLPAERAWLYEYAGAGDRRLLAIAWGGRTDAFAGETVAAGVLDILPAA